MSEPQSNSNRPPKNKKIIKVGQKTDLTKLIVVALRSLSNQTQRPGASLAAVEAYIESHFILEHPDVIIAKQLKLSARHAVKRGVLRKSGEHEYALTDNANSESLQQSSASAHEITACQSASRNRSPESDRESNNRVEVKRESVDIKPNTQTSPERNRKRDGTTLRSPTKREPTRNASQLNNRSAVKNDLKPGDNEVACHTPKRRTDESFDSVDGVASQKVSKADDLRSHASKSTNAVASTADKLSGPTDRSIDAAKMALSPNSNQRKRRKIARPIPLCSFCRGSVEENRDRVPEILLCCVECGYSGHPSCLKFSDELVERIKTLRWLCIECKRCYECEQAGAREDNLLFCDGCDRGFHLCCLRPPLSRAPRGDWRCNFCDGSRTDTPKDLLDAEAGESCHIPLDVIRNRNRNRNRKDRRDRDEDRPSPKTKEKESSSNSNDHNSTVLKSRPRGRPPKAGRVDSSDKPRVSSKKMASTGSTILKRRLDAAKRKLKVSRGRVPVRNKRQGDNEEQSSSESDSGDESESDAESETNAKTKQITKAAESTQPKVSLPSNVTENDFDLFRRACETAAQSIKLNASFLVRPPIDRDRMRAVANSNEKGKRARLNARKRLQCRVNPANHIAPLSPSVVCRYPPTITIGKHQVGTWYSAPYPQEYARLSELFVCEFCLSYFKSAQTLERHAEKCQPCHPPANEIYRSPCPSTNTIMENAASSLANGASTSGEPAVAPGQGQNQGLLSVWEVDGQTQKLYCQNLCLLAKAFLDHKTLYYDVEPFLFYVLTVRDSPTDPHQFVGYFSKEKHCPNKYNVSCITVLPPFQRLGFGRFLIEFSYLLSRCERQPGTPEKPLSELGRISYHAYWKSVLVEHLDARKQASRNDSSGNNEPSATAPAAASEVSISLRELVETTGVCARDFVETMFVLGMLVSSGDGDRLTLRVRSADVEAYMKATAKKRAARIPIFPDALRWTPYIGPTIRTNEEDGYESDVLEAILASTAPDSAVQVDASAQSAPNIPSSSQSSARIKGSASNDAQRQNRLSKRDRFRANAVASPRTTERVLRSDPAAKEMLSASLSAASIVSRAENGNDETVSKDDEDKMDVNSPGAERAQRARARPSDRNRKKTKKRVGKRGNKNQAREDDDEEEPVTNDEAIDDENGFGVEGDIVIIHEMPTSSNHATPIKQPPPCEPCTEAAGSQSQDDAVTAGDDTTVNMVDASDVQSSRQVNPDAHQLNGAQVPEQSQPEVQSVQASVAVPTADGDASQPLVHSEAKPRQAIADGELTAQPNHVVQPLTVDVSVSSNSATQRTVAGAIRNSPQLSAASVHSPHAAPGYAHPPHSGIHSPQGLSMQQASPHAKVSPYRAVSPTPRPATPQAAVAGQFAPSHVMGTTGWAQHSPNNTRQRNSSQNQTQQLPASNCSMPNVNNQVGAVPSNDSQSLMNIAQSNRTISSYGYMQQGSSTGFYNTAQIGSAAQHTAAYYTNSNSTPLHNPTTSMNSAQRSDCVDGGANSLYYRQNQPVANSSVGRNYFNDRNHLAASMNVDRTYSSVPVNASVADRNLYPGCAINTVPHTQTKAATQAQMPMPVATMNSNDPAWNAAATSNNSFSFTALLMDSNRGGNEASTSAAGSAPLTNSIPMPTTAPLHGNATRNGSNSGYERDYSQLPNASNWPASWNPASNW